MNKLLLLALLSTGCASTSQYLQVEGEVPHYGLSAVKVSGGMCYVYVERNNGSSISCVQDE